MPVRRSTQIRKVDIRGLVLPFICCILFLSTECLVSAFTSEISKRGICNDVRGIQRLSLLNRKKTRRHCSGLKSISDNSSSTINSGISEEGLKWKPDLKQIRQEGGALSFNTPLGALNPFGIYYGGMSLAFGLAWYFFLTCTRIFYFVTRNRFDRKRRIPVFLSHVWGTLVLRMSLSFPYIENRALLDDLYKSNTTVMFVANHNSWLDIPLMGATIGWRNYKFVAKHELRKIPIMGDAISLGENILVHRTDRKSQIKALKGGIQWLKNGVHLCTFPEGTRSRGGRLMEFKQGAFVMAQKAGVPIVPLSIVSTAKVMPCHWMFPFSSTRSIGSGSACGVKVVVHKPISSVDKTNDELCTAARQAIISGLPEEQRPLE